MLNILIASPRYPLTQRVWFLSSFSTEKKIDVK